MTTYYGKNINNTQPTIGVSIQVLNGKINYNFDRNVVFPETPAGKEADQYFLYNHQHGYQPNSIDHCAKSRTEASSFGNEIMLEDVWFAPAAFSLGFITDTSENIITVWNTKQHSTISITAISEINPSGTSLETLTLPLVIPRNKERNITLTVLQVGPPLQDTTHQFTIDGVQSSTYTSGLRVLPIKPEPNWRGDIQLSLIYETAMFTNERLYEQRRPLRSNFLKEQTMEFNVGSLNAQKFFEDLIYGQDKVFAVPMYQEGHLVASATQDGTVIVIEGDTTYDWFLQNKATHIVISDHENFVSEIKELGTIAAGQINTVGPISSSYTNYSAMVYPIYFGIIKNVEFKHLNQQFDTIDITFTEFTGG